MKIIFQGDAATDSGRDRSNPRDMGDGYPKYASAMLTDSYPDTEFEFYNFAEEGMTAGQLAQSLNDDFIEIRPDVVSVMIGADEIQSEGYDDGDYEDRLKTYLSGLKIKTDAYIILIQPYLPQSATDSCAARYESVKAVNKKTAEAYADAYISLDRLPSDEEEDDEDESNLPSDDISCLIGEYLLGAVSRLIEKPEAEE